jgi:ABC-type lipopolysaccharide export system ATPase subunit
MVEALAIDVYGMTKRFGDRTAVDHVDLRVRTGEICGFFASGFGAEKRNSGWATTPPSESKTGVYSTL